VQGWVPVNPRNIFVNCGLLGRLCFAAMTMTDTGHYLLITGLLTAGMTLIWLAMRGAPLI
jgi:hypothetical protein